MSGHAQSQHPLDRTVLLLELDAFDSLDRDTAIETITNTRVKLSTDDASMRSAAGQTALVAAFIALAQMGVCLTLDVPDAPLLGPQPPLIGDTIRTALVELGADLVQPCRNATEHHMTMAIGDAPCDADGHRLTGGDWGASVEIGGPPRAWTGSLPIGGALAGVLAGAASLPIIITRLESRRAARTRPPSRSPSEGCRGP